MNFSVTSWVLTLTTAFLFPVAGQESTSLEEAKALGIQRSKYRKSVSGAAGNQAPTANLADYRKEIEPLLQQACIQCHGPDKQKADFRVDTLDPDLLNGGDVSWWLEVVDVISNGEMPPPDEEEVDLPEKGRAAIIDWLSQELLVASQFRRSEKGHTSFRRMTRYEFGYALEDLLGVPLDFSDELPPETASHDGFKNSSEMLQMSASQFEQYRKLALEALEKATVRGERPQESYFPIDFAEIARAEATQKAAAAKQKPKPAGTNAPHFFDRTSGEAISNPRYNLRGKPFASVDSLPEIPAPTGEGLVLTGNGKVVLNLGSDLPEKGNLKVRLRASRNPEHEGTYPRLQLFFGFQASNNSHANSKVSQHDLTIEALPDTPEFYEFVIPITEKLERNPFRGQRIAKVNSSESLILRNATPNGKAYAFIDYVEVITPAYEQWPPDSHRRVFASDSSNSDEREHAREVLTAFLRKAWRREISESEIDRKLALYEQVRPGSEDHQAALIEVLANVLASPHFLYLVQGAEPDPHEVATRLSMFLWASVPDEELLELAASGGLDNTDVLQQQVNRLLTDPRSSRFSKHFVRQWLGLDLLDYLQVDAKVYRQFDADLKEAMQREPVVFFEELLGQNQSVLNFLHSDFAVVNERLARHYGMSTTLNGAGDFQRVSLDDPRRGGLLSQAGLLAMNSDGKDSHPLKRGIWLLERILNDPPPPPPPSVPEIDLADPEILKMTLKERMEDHRDDAACRSCHQRIDPWGIAFENFDAVGAWREKIGNEPVDASSTLFNQEELEGIEGLKEYLLLDRQDQFTNALVHKMCAYALGRPITFADRSEIEQITSQLRRDGDGLATLVALIVTSDLFRSY